MFGYATVFGYILPRTIRKKGDIMTFKISISANNSKIFECRVKDRLTIDWIDKYIETKLFQGKLVALQGELDSYLYSSNGINIRKTTIVVSNIEFLDFTPNGFNAIDGGKFYDRYKLNWEIHFNKEAKKK